MLADCPHAAIDLDGTSIIGVSQAVGLLIGKAIDVKVVLVEHALVLSAVGFRLHVVEHGENDLECYTTIRASLMLGSLSHYLKLPGQLLQTSIVVELTHEALDVQHIWEVLSQVLFEGVSVGWHVLIHEDLE